jgi:hypothetical protein
MKLNEIGLKDSTSILAQRSVILESPVAGVTPRIMETSRNIYFLAGNNDVFKFDLDDDGRRQARELDRAWRQRSARARLRTSYNAYKVSTPSANRITNVSQIRASTLPRTARLMGSASLRAFFKFLRYWGVTEMLTNSLLVNIANYEQQFQDGVIDETEFEDRVQVAYGLWSLQISAIIFRALRQSIRAVITILSRLRDAVRTFSLRGLFTGIGTIPSIMGLLGSQVAFHTIAYILTRPSVQNKFVDWVISWGQSGVIGAMFQGGVEFAGTLMQGAASALNSVTGGLLGSEDLFDTIGGTEAMGGDAYTKGRTEIPGLEGTAFASQEWAKLVFQDLLFPPGTSIEDKLVPYMDFEQRENRLAETFGEFTAPSEPEQAEPYDDAILRRARGLGNVTPSGNNNQSRPTSTGQSQQPVVPTGRVSSSRPRGSQPTIRPGDETNALDAIAADNVR